MYDIHKNVLTLIIKNYFVFLCLILAKYFFLLKYISIPAYPSLGWSLSQHALGEKWGTSWTGCQSIAGPVSEYQNH